MDKLTEVEIRHKLMHSDQAELRPFFRRASAELGDLIIQSIAPNEDVYVLGLNYDFDIFARHYAVTLGDRLVGVTAINSEPYLTADGHRLFSTEGMCISENPVRPPNVVVIFLAVASDGSEIATLSSSLLHQIGYARVIVVTMLTSQSVRHYASRWARLDGPSTEFIALAETAEDIRAVRDQLYERLRKDRPPAPMWVVERIAGPLPEHIRARYGNAD